MEKTKSQADDRRARLRKELWPDEDVWTGEEEVGWFAAPRTLPLIMHVLRSKEIGGNQDPTSVYLELWARHMGGGLIEMEPEGVHAYHAGYVGSRGVRTWQERMRILEENGFIKVESRGNLRYGYVSLVHPTTVTRRLYDAGKVDEELWKNYRMRQSETGAPSHDDRKESNASTSPRTVPPQTRSKRGKSVQSKSQTG